MALYTHVCTQSCVQCTTKFCEPHLLYHMVMANAWLKIKKNPSGLFFSGSSALSEQPKSPNPLTHAMVSTVGAAGEILTQNHRRLANIILVSSPSPLLFSFCSFSSASFSYLSFLLLTLHGLLLFLPPILFPPRQRTVTANVDIGT